MDRIAIIGAGGFGREVKMLIDQINRNKPRFEIYGFYDDDQNLPDFINGVPYRGPITELENVKFPLCIALGLGYPNIKKKIIDVLLKNKLFSFPTIIHPSVLIGNDDVKIGPGSIICGGTVITVNINIGSFVTLNLCCTVGHDAHINDFSSLMPTVNISGEVTVGEATFIGTGAKIINGISIGKNVTIGAGAVVIRDVEDGARVVGNPGRVL